MSWVQIITTVVNVVATIISDKSKANAAKAAEASKNMLTPQQIQESNMRAAGYVLQGDTWVNQHAAVTEGEYKMLSDKNKKSRFGGPPLTADEQQKLTAYKNSNGQANALTSPIAYPDAGLGSGLGSYSNPGQIPNVDIHSNPLAKPLAAIKEGGMNTWLMLGLIGGGGAILYKANQKPKRRR